MLSFFSITVLFYFCLILWNKNYGFLNFFWPIIFKSHSMKMYTIYKLWIDSVDAMISQVHPLRYHLVNCCILRNACWFQWYHCFHHSSMIWWCLILLNKYYGFRNFIDQSFVSLIPWKYVNNSIESRRYWYNKLNTIVQNNSKNELFTADPSIVCRIANLNVKSGYKPPNFESSPEK